MTDEPRALLEAATDLWRASGGVGRVPVEGGSMRPLLQPGDTVRVRAGEVRLGDLVVARTAQGLVVHRLISRGSGGVVLRGDDTPASDPPVAHEAVLGRVTAVEGMRGRRLDTSQERALGVLTAAYAWVQRATGHRLSRPRPRAIPGLALAVEDRISSPMPAEDTLTLLVARPEPDAGALDQARALVAGGLDWDAVVARARLGQIGPLVFVGVKRLGDDAGVPDEALDALRALYVGNLQRSRWMEQVLVEMLGRLAAEGIEVMGHKGVALASTVYADPALRIAGDIDLSARDEDRRRAEEAVADLRDALVRANPDRRDLDGLHVELDGTAHHDLEPSLFGGGHWRTESLDWPAIWESAVPVDVGGHPMLVPCPTDLLLTLVANSLRRGFTPVRLVCDIAHTVHRYGDAIDWWAFEVEARRTRLDRRSWIALGLAVDWFDAGVPASMLEPPDDLRLAVYERALLDQKHRQPYTRLPTRVLWAGGWREAAEVGRSMVREG